MAPSTPGFDKPVPRPDFPALEREMLRLWADKDIFARSLRGDIDASGEEKAFVFYDGPPFATGLPHYGHLLAGTLKDIVPRYWTMRGYRVERRFGWDTHGLPVEMEIEKKLGLNGPQEIRDYGIDNYNEQCRSIVLRYTEAWRSTVTRLGRWVDFDNDYKTLDPSFMESVWWVFAELWRKGLIYQGYKVMPYSWRLGTPLSNFEANMDYRKVQDPAVTVTLPAEDGSGDVFLAWTTTPWTLPSNMALCVGPDMDYVRARKAGEPTVYVLAKARAEAVLGEDHEVLEELKGTALVGRTYTPLFDSYTALAAEGAFRVVADGYVTADDGTGIVHQAPAFGEDDWRVCEREGIPLRDPVDAEGKFTAEVPLVEGMRVKEADAVLIKDLKERGRLLRHDTLDHEYPFCWRSGTPLIYKAISTWFVKVTDINKRMVALNEQTRWVPDYVGEKRFSNWLKDARDWAISRNRYWGTPLPIWQCTGCDHTEVFGSIETLSARAETPVTDLHKHHVDKLHFDCPECGGQMDRVPEVLDCWFESGAMPYAQNHYPFENKELVENNLPADFIAEGLDQTRGWFYTLLILSTALFDRPAFKNVIVNGLILAEDGQKMSKSLGNITAPQDVCNQHGADILRLWVVGSNYSEDLRIGPEIVKFHADIYRRLRNTLRYLLGNLDGFNEAERVAFDEMPELERWVLTRLWRLDKMLRSACDSFEFHGVFTELHNFCAVDLSAFYFDIRKDTLYCDRADSIERRAARTVLDELFNCLTAWLAPFLCFTAEEAWQQRLDAPDPMNSVHRRQFPDIADAWHDEALEEKWRIVRQVRRAVTGALELERAEKRIGASLQAHVTVHVTAEQAAALEGLDLPAIFITSSGEITTAPAPEGAYTTPEAPGVGVVPVLATGEKCERCWKVLPDVGSDPDHPTVCARCADAVRHSPLAAE
jgi:isoleucyl-tRNA synthetase